MKTLLISFLGLWIGSVCFGQEIEFCGSLNTSSDQKFQNAYGVGLQYQHDINQKYKVGLGFHYNFNNCQFDEISRSDANPSIYDLSRVISSNAKRFSFRLSLQRFLKNNDYVAFLLGPEISYNFLWGHCNQYYTQSRNFNFSSWPYNYKLVHAIGFGLFSQVEIKNILIPKLSLCFNIRPEIIYGGPKPDGGTRAFTGITRFTEFQIGFKYKLNK